MANKLPAVIPSGTNKYYTPSLSFNRVATDHISPGVVGLMANTSGVGPASGGFGVSAQGSPNMTVAVNSGVAYVAATPTGGTAQLFGVTSDASENVTVASNATGSTRYDFLYLKLDPDKLNNPASAGTDVPTLVIQRSTTQYVDSNGALANGLLLAEITVTNGAATITNANISDRRVLAEPVEHDGWINPSETWTYASATTFTISGDKTLRYSTGDKLSLYQSGSRKYFYVTAVVYSSPNTTLTITGGTDYTLANAAIYNNVYSKASTPNGFPQWLSYTPVWTSAGSNPSLGNGTLTGRFQMSGKTVNFKNELTLGSTSSTVSATAFRFSLPVTGNSNWSVSVMMGGWSGENPGVQGYGGLVRNQSSTTSELLYVSSVAGANALVGATSPATWANTWWIRFSGSYEAA